MKNATGASWGFAAVMVATIVVIGCGGGGSKSSSGATSGNRPPVAPNPTCSNAIEKPATRTQGIPAAGQSGIIVPATSIERPGDIGVRFHTNHLIKGGPHRDIPGLQGLTPLDVSAAYGPGNASAGAIAIVDAYNYPNALSDFNYFANTFGLPTESSANATASSNQTFQVVYASGSQPQSDGGWSQEMAIDIEWAHAMAPNAKIYLVEATDAGFANIMAAVAVAKNLPGVREVSTSFGGTETGCSYVQYDSTFVQPGVAFFAAAGDTAGERDFPALSLNVVDVGGTTLNMTPGGIYLNETVWNGTGCGPSAFEPRPIFQDVYYSKIGLYRGGCDIAAIADPNTGVAAYDSYSYQGQSGWFVVGGTSVACPIIAGIANSSGIVFPSSQAFNKACYSVAGSQYFHRITSGSSGGFSAGTPWCFPTGLGSPNGLAGALRG